jgi:hypothetical protein
MGYAHICLDLEGYASGKMNHDIENKIDLVLKSNNC